MIAAELLGRLLAIEPPWQVVDVNCDTATRRIDVQIGPKAARSGWFSRQKVAAPDGVLQTWRHLNLAGWRCFIHAPATLGQGANGPSWGGDGDMPFTRAMSREVAKLLMEGLKFPAVCKVLDVQIGDVWKFKHGLDSGRTGLSEVRPPPASAAGKAVDGAPARVPVPADPVWERLLDGSLDIDIRVLGLKLLLTKLRDHMRRIEDTEVRQLKVHEVHRYFARHEQVLGHELAQLRVS